MIFLVSLSRVSWGQLVITGTASPNYFSSYSIPDKNLAKTGIHILGGNSLIIDEDIDFNPGASIIVDKWYTTGIVTYLGAKLEIRKKLHCSSGIWSGIRVYGDAGLPHYTTNPNESIKNSIASYRGVINAYHGFVDIQEGTIIEKAEHGIWSTDGGIIQSFVGPLAIKPQFIDCQEGIYIEQSNQNPSATRINRCDFIWTDPNLHGFADYANFIHVSIIESKDIRLGGCDITGEYGYSNKYNTDKKGTGVLVTGYVSTFSIGEAGNTFQNDTGGCVAIKYYSDPTAIYGNFIGQFSTGVNAVSCKDAAINHTFFAANMVASRIVGDFADFHDNVFKAEDAWLAQHFNPTPSITSKLCIDLQSINKASIYRNTFNYHNFSFSPSPWPAIAMVSVGGNGGGDIKFIDNTFNGDVNTTKKTQYAISGGGDLQNLEWTCNTFNDFETAVIYGGTTGPASNPKSGLNLAGNVYNNITLEWVKNLTGTVTAYYNSAAPFFNIGLYFPPGGEVANCNIDCSQIETKYKISPTQSNIIEESEKVEFSIYPNPAKENFVLTTEDYVNKRIIVFNSTGELLFEQEINSSTITLDVSGFNPGLYFVLLKSDRKQSIKKLIIAR